MSRQAGRKDTHGAANLSTWWLTAVEHAVAASNGEEHLAYEEIAPQLEEHSSLLDNLDGELVSAARYVYAPK
jgi:hypothetical protein